MIARARSLRTMLAIYVVLVLIALIGVRVIDDAVMRHALARDVDLRLASEASEIVGLPTRAAMVQRIDEAENDRDAADLHYLLADTGGRPLAGKLRLRTIPPPGYSDLSRRALADGGAHRRALLRATRTGDTLVVMSGSATIDGLDRLALIQFAGLGAGFLIVIGGAIGIMISISYRIRTMQRAIDAVAAGDLRSRIAIEGALGDFDRQAAAFNRMLDRINELMENIRHAASDVAHELKSPLARLRSRAASLARQYERDPAGPGFAELLGQTDEAVAIFSSLRRLSEIEGGQRRDRFADMDVGALVGEVAGTLAMVAEDAGQVLTVEANAGPVIRADTGLIRQMLVNMVENAIRHTPAGARILVVVRMLADASHVAISVTDNGPGIPPIHYARAVQRFGRLETATPVPGQGLGLTLVDAIARLHHGTLNLTDAGPGLCVTVTLPIAGR